MKNKYLLLYYISSIITYSISLFTIYFKGKSNSDIFYDFNNYYEYFNYYPFATILLIVCFVILIINIILNVKKINFEERNIIIPFSYLTFMIIMIIFSLMMKKYIVIKDIQYPYYYSFVIFDYLLLNIYTLISFKSKNKKDKKKE